MARRQKFMEKTIDYILKKYDITVDRKYVIDIPNIGRDNLAELFAELGFKKGVEVGVEKGLYSEVLCKANPDLHLTCVDPWLASAYEPGIHAVDTEQSKFDERYKETVKKLKPYNCTIIRKTSLDAVDDFEDESLDFVYIDANHDFPNFTNDLHQWKKKVRIGGIVSGHDYAYFSHKKFNHVKRVLEAYTRCYRMIPIFVAGADTKTSDKSITREKFRSWFWVKE